MKLNLTKKALLTCIALCTSSSLLAIKSIAFGSPAPKQEKFFLPEEVVLNFVAEHYLADHQAICNFAATSKHYKALIIATAPNRKTKLNYAEPANIPFGKWIHRFGNAHCYAYQPYGLNDLVLHFHELGAIKTITTLQKFSNFIAALPHKLEPIFNEQGNMCFYGYGELKYQRKHVKTIRKTKKGIIRYCTDGSAQLCLVQTQDPDKKPLPMNILLSYPSVLKALLTVQPKQRIVADAHNSRKFLVFPIEDAIIPDDYKRRVPFYFKSKEDCLTPQPSFEDFPDYVKEAIETQHREQPKQKIAIQ